MTFKKINPNEEDLQKKLERIIDRKIKSCMKEKGLLNSSNVVMESPFTEEIMAYSSIGKLKTSSY